MAWTHLSFSTLIRMIVFFIHMIQGVTEQFDKYENDVNKQLWFSHLPDIDPDEHNSDFD